MFLLFLIVGGTIADLIQLQKNCNNTQWPTLSEKDSLGFTEDVLTAVKFLQSRGIVHRDINGNVRIVFYSLRSDSFVVVDSASCKR